MLEITLLILEMSYFLTDFSLVFYLNNLYQSFLYTKREAGCTISICKGYPPDDRADMVLECVISCFYALNIHEGTISAQESGRYPAYRLDCSTKFRHAVINFVS